MFFINVQDYGAVCNGGKNSGRKNREAIQAAIDGALVANKRLWFPAGTYEVEAKAGDIFKIPPGAELEIFGTDKDQVTIRVQNDPGDFNLFAVASGGSKFTIREMTLSGPTPDVNKNRNAIAYMSGGDGAGKTEALYEDLIISGFSHCIWIVSASGRGGSNIRVIRCDLQAVDMCIAHWADADNLDKHLLVQDCYIHDTVRSHGIYNHPHANLRVIGGRIENIAGWGIHWQGTAVGSSAQYQEVIGVSFVNARIVVMDAAGSEISYAFTGCSFSGGGQIQARGAVMAITGCTFYKLDPANPAITAQSGKDSYVSVSGCTFDYRGTARAAVGCIDLVDWDTASIVGCTFRSSASSPSITQWISASAGRSDEVQVEITGCNFYHADSGVRTVVFTVTGPVAGVCRVSNCTLNGNGVHDRGVFRLRGLDSNFRMYIDGFTQKHGTTGYLVWIGNDNYGEVELHNIKTYNTTWIKAVDRPRGVTAIARWFPSNGIDTVASASDMIIDSNSNFWIVTGDTDVDNISFWDAGQVSNWAFTGRITIQADPGGAGFNLTDAGNIDLSASSRAVAAGEMLDLVYIPEQGTWRLW